jgi:hypothetical protein
MPLALAAKQFYQLTATLTDVSKQSAGDAEPSVSPIGGCFHRRVGHPDLDHRVPMHK